MNAFHTIAVPHRDILEENLQMDVFAADLWNVYTGKAPLEYQDSDEFFKKTYLTYGLKQLIENIENRIHGKGGNPVIQLHTPFGGGKTHSLIALYHKAKEWDIKTSVIVGTFLSAEEKIWEIIERQLTGKVEILKGDAAPGRARLSKVLNGSKPALILMDELLEYITKATTIKVGDSNLASQTIAFMQELTEEIKSLNNIALVITLPSSHLEHYDEVSEKLLQQLQKVIGRVESIYSPVQDDEVTHIIRRRLFSKIDESKLKNVVDQVVDFFYDNNLIPEGIEKSEYKKSFLNSYPFLPEVIDVLYTRWGSFPSFQRTRGVLRLLALVINSNKQRNVPYLSLADFNLASSEIRRELIKHIGAHYEGVIATDIVNENSGAKKVDKKLASSYSGLMLGTRVANTVFMYSFSGGDKKGVRRDELKRVATTLDNPVSEIVEVLEELKNTLFYMQEKDGFYFFSNQPNLNQVINTKIENINEHHIENLIKEKFTKLISNKLKTYLWITESTDIIDDQSYKLVILKTADENLMKFLIDKKGSTPRIYKNTIFFLAPSENELNMLYSHARKHLAYKMTVEDTTLNLSSEQKDELKRKIQESERNFYMMIRNAYRYVYTIKKDGFQMIDLGSSIFGNEKKVDEEVFETLEDRSVLINEISPIVLEKIYLKNNDYVKLEDVYLSSLKVPGEIRFISKDVLVKATKKGVREGIFGVGVVFGKDVECKYFKNEFENIDFDLYVIRKELCEQHKREKLSDQSSTDNKTQTTIDATFENDNERKEDIFDTEKTIDDVTCVDLKFKIPAGKFSEIMKMLMFVNSKFNDIELTIKATNGNISKNELENVIIETLLQLNIEFDNNSS